jgi:hypothetical protein
MQGNKREHLKASPPLARYCIRCLEYLLCHSCSSDSLPGVVVSERDEENKVSEPVYVVAAIQKRYFSVWISLKDPITKCSSSSVILDGFWLIFVALCIFLYS